MMKYMGYVDMAAYKFIDGNRQIGFLYPYQDLLVSMTEALKDQNLIAYIDLVTHLRNMSILAFDKNDLENLERVDGIITGVKRHIDRHSNGKLTDSRIFRMEEINYERVRNMNLKIFCEHKFSGVIERICIASLRKTIFREQIPEAQNGRIFYDPARDIENAIKQVNCILEENNIELWEVSV